MAPLALALLLSLPPEEQVTPRSLPRAVAAELARGKAPPTPDALLRLHRFQGESQTLFVVGLPCPAHTDAPQSCPVALLLNGRETRRVGATQGTLIDVSDDSQIPDVLYFEVGPGEEDELRFTGDRYVARRVARRYRDPLTRERRTAEGLREAALDDLQQGRYAAAAGRYQILCARRCPVLDLEAMATAALGVKLATLAESTLRRAVSLPGHQAQDWETLAELLRLQGRNAEAAEAEAHFSKERPSDGGAVSAP